MAEKRRGKRRKEDPFLKDEEQVEKPEKDEYTIARWMKKNVPTKKTKFLYHNVEYFTGSKAVDALLESQWAKPKKEGIAPMFGNRQDIVIFLDTMLRHKFFHRAKKVPVSEQELIARRKKRMKDKDEKKVEKDEKTEDAESSHAEGKVEEKGEGKDEKDKKKRKIRLEMHLDQFFVDNLDAYVWIYDPIPIYYWLCGTLLVLGAIAVCLFPLWPPEVRKGVYYLSVAAAGFLCFIIALAVLRLIVFCILWALTLGKHHLWLFPNLTEDVGFFASFWPLYQYEYKGDLNDKKKKKKKDKDSDEEQEDDKSEDQEEEKSEEQKENTEDDRKSASESESESSSQKSQTGKDFEIVDKNEVEAVEKES